MFKRRPLTRLASEKGQLLETFLAAVIIAMVLISIAEIMLRHSVTTTKLKRYDQSKQLADMILEQYNSWTGSQTNGAQQMLQHNVTNALPGAFFSTPGDMGFSGLTVTTNASCSGQLSASCSVDVTITSIAGGTRTYKRSFATQMNDHTGATVDVWVLPATCNAALPETYHGCGLAASTAVGGFQIVASSSAVPPPSNLNLFGTSEVVAFTQQDGHAILHNVATNVSLIISARKAGSAVYDQNQGGIATPGFYVDGTTWTTDTQQFTALPNQPNVVTPFQKFLPLGTVQGTLTNLDGGPVNGMMVVLQSTASTGFGIQYNPTWNVLTDASGNYVFSNVLPGNVYVFGAGDPGTEVAIPPGFAGTNSFNFRQGYSNHSVFNVPLSPATSMSSPAPTAGIGVTVNKLGSLHIKADPSWPPGDQISIATRLPPTLFRHSILIGDNASHSTNAQLPLDLYNVFDDPVGVNLTFSGYSFNPGTGLVDGYFKNLVAGPFKSGSDNTITIRPFHPHQFTATLVAAPGAPIPASSVYVYCSQNVACADPPVAATLGVPFTFNIFTPEMTGPSANQFQMVVALPPSNWYTNAVSNVNGTVNDVIDAAQIPSVTLTDLLSPVHSTVANSAGSFHLNLGSAQEGYVIQVNFTCPPGEGTVCTPVGGPGLPSPNIGIDTTLIGGNLYVDSTFGGTLNQYYQFPKSFIYTNGQASLSASRDVTLQYYGLSGTVIDATTNQPIPSIQVCDKSWQLSLASAGDPTVTQPNPPKNNQCVTTGPAGTYTFDLGPGNLPISVSNRYIDQTTAPGTVYYGYVEAYVPNNQFSSVTGRSYAGGDTGPIDITEPPAPPPFGATGYSKIAANPILLRPSPGSI